MWEMKRKNSGTMETKRNARAIDRDAERKEKGEKKIINGDGWARDKDGCIEFCDYYERDIETTGEHTHTQAHPCQSANTHTHTKRNMFHLFIDAILRRHTYTAYSFSSLSSCMSLMDCMLLVWYSALCVRSVCCWFFHCRLHRLCRRRRRRWHLVASAVVATIAVAVTTRRNRFFSEPARMRENDWGMKIIAKIHINRMFKCGYNTHYAYGVCLCVCFCVRASALLYSACMNACMYILRNVSHFSIVLTRLYGGLCSTCINTMSWCTHMK